MVLYLVIEGLVQDSTGKMTGTRFAPADETLKMSFQIKLILFFEVLQLVNKSSYMNHINETYSYTDWGTTASDMLFGEMG